MCRNVLAALYLLLRAGFRPMRLRNLQYSTLWLSIGWLLVGTVIYLSLTPMPPRAIEMAGGDKFGHFIAYFSVMLWFVQVCEHRTCSNFAFGFIAMAVVLEFLQQLCGYRTLEVFDMAAGATGVVAAYALAFTPLAMALVYFEDWARRIIDKLGR